MEAGVQPLTCWSAGNEETQLKIIIIKNLEQQHSCCMVYSSTLNRTDLYWTED